MFCSKCGKEIGGNSKFCEACGTAVEQATQSAASTAEIIENGKKKRVKFKDLPKKKKITRIVIAGICFLIAFVIILGDASGGAGNVEGYIVETGNDDIFGGVSFDLTLEEFVDEYNSALDNDEEYDLAASMNKISLSDFESADSGDGWTAYKMSFGYTTGGIIPTSHILAALLFTVNTETEKIQAVKYIWNADGYNTEQAEQNYYFKIPARIMSFFIKEIDYPYNGDTSSYIDFFEKYQDEVENNDTSAVRSGNLIYGLFDTGDSSVIGFQALAASENSEFLD